MQATVLHHGESYFNSDGTKPLVFYKVLLLVGLYEDAVRYLDSVGSYQIQNTHVAFLLDGLGITNYDAKEESKREETSMNKSGKRYIPTFPKIINSFIEFLGQEYLSESLIYASLLKKDYQIRLISHLFIKYNKFGLLLETEQKTNLNLVTHKNQPLSKFIKPENIAKITQRV